MVESNATSHLNLCQLMVGAYKMTRRRIGADSIRRACAPKLPFPSRMHGPEADLCGLVRTLSQTNRPARPMLLFLVNS